MTNAQDPLNTDLEHAATNGVTLQDLSARSLIPPGRLRCMLSHETVDSLGGLCDDVDSVSCLHDVLGGFGQ